MAIALSKVETIDRNMDTQNKYVKEILDLIDTCVEKDLLGEVTEDEVQQLRDHCKEIAEAADTAKKLVANIRPVLKEEEDAQKAKDKAAADAKKKADALAKRKATIEKRKAQQAAEAEEADSTDDDLDFLG